MMAIICLLTISPLITQAQDITVTSYNLGEATIIQDNFAPDSRFYNMPVTLQGVLALPAGDGPFPVALFIHGSYPFCTALGEEADVYPCPPEDDLRQYEGFSYLAEALAQQGFITIVPDVSAEFNNGYGEPIFAVRAIQIIKAHLDALAAGEGFDVEIASKADFERLVIASHSRGGPLALSYLNAETTYEASALVLLTPAFLAPDTVIPETMPTALVIAECDGDVGTDQPLIYYDEQLPPLRPVLTTIYMLPAGTHNAFSPQLGADLRQPCEGDELLDSQVQRDFAAQFLPDFFDMALAYGHLPDAA